MKTKAMLIDITKCIGCRACEQACKEVHHFPMEHEPALSATAFTVVEERGDKFVRRLCMHCQDPACASVCPVGALKKTAFGPVVYDGKKCIGCRYCMLACPYSVPRYEWSKLAPYVKKCDMCAERVAAGKHDRVRGSLPGRRDHLRRSRRAAAEAQKRIRENPAYVNRIYGSEEEVGGASVFFLSDVPFEKLGFVKPPQTTPLPALSEAALGEMPTVVMIGGSLLAGLYWFTQRRQQVMAVEATEKEPRTSCGSGTRRGAKP